jgi:hypothetical protein
LFRYDSDEVPHASALTDQQRPVTEYGDRLLGDTQESPQQFAVPGQMPDAGCGPGELSNLGCEAMFPPGSFDQGTQALTLADNRSMAYYWHSGFTPPQDTWDGTSLAFGSVYYPTSVQLASTSGLMAEGHSCSERLSLSAISTGYADIGNTLIRFGR